MREALGMDDMFEAARSIEARALRLSEAFAIQPKRKRGEGRKGREERGKEKPQGATGISCGSNSDNPFVREAVLSFRLIPPRPPARPSREGGEKGGRGRGGKGGGKLPVSRAMVSTLLLSEDKNSEEDSEAFPHSKHILQDVV